MTTEIDVGVAEDAFEKNNLIKLECSTYETTIALSVVDWIAKRFPRDAALLDVLHFVYRSIFERMDGYHVWLLLGDTRWQDDTRIIRFRKMFSSLKAQGLEFKAFQDRREFMIEQFGRLKFFGAVRLDEDELALVPKVMQPGSCTYLLALPGILPDLPEFSGWSGRLNEDSELIQLNVKNDGIIFQRVGYFDDPEVGLVALGKPNVLARLVAQR
ncbi:hypothetical protein GXB81_14885 [Paraburkholderia sp. Ac-20336]|uniref:hypothetical protein n=1 Tax=Paraburkholderia sp. Ac-20336 TaxID=2703886 RepID=UPI0019822077|nr:hypothetical protein [Paraburkholderia sp. Ac-20336]MBN3804326.1 hypothetical protein [Paraburkholderia sp. Ac-20336]